MKFLRTPSTRLLIKLQHAQRTTTDPFRRRKSSPNAGSPFFDTRSWMGKYQSPLFFAPFLSVASTFLETTEIFIQESSSDTRPSNLHDSEISFIQERQEPAGRRQAYHSTEESCLSSQSLSVGHVRTGRPVNEFGSLSSSVRENPSRNDKPPDIWDTHGIWGNVFVNPPASSSSPYPGGSICGQTLLGRDE